MTRAVWTDTADYMILRCAACGMPHIVHQQMMRDGISCRDCGAGPLIPEGYAIMLDKRPEDIIVKTQVDTSDLDKVRRMVDVIQTSVSSMIEKLTETKERLEHGTDCHEDGGHDSIHVQPGDQQGM